MARYGLTLDGGTPTTSLPAEESHARWDWVPSAVLTALCDATERAYELPLPELRASVCAAQPRSATTYRRFAAALGYLERQHLLWRTPRGNRDGLAREPERVGLTQRALELVAQGGVEAALVSCRTCSRLLAGAPGTRARRRRSGRRAERQP